MASPKNLTLGVNQPSPTDDELRERIDTLRATVRRYLPGFEDVVANAAAGGDGNVIALHQDAFAAGYHDDEFTLLGMAIKYAGLFGVTVNMIGKNRETLESPGA